MGKRELHYRCVWCKCHARSRNKGKCRQCVTNGSMELIRQFTLAEHHLDNLPEKEIEDILLTRRIMGVGAP